MLTAQWLSLYLTFMYLTLWHICTVFPENLKVEPQRTEFWWIMMNFSCINSSSSPDSRPVWMRDWRISTTAADCGWWRRPISNREGKSPKSDSGGAQERDRGSVSTALEGEQKARLTGEPVRIDRPTSSCQRELIWHQQSFYVKQGKGQEDPRVQSQACSCIHGSMPSGSNEQRATTTEDDYRLARANVREAQTTPWWIIFDNELRFKPAGNCN